MKVTHCKAWYEICSIPNKNGMYINDSDGTKVTFKNNILHSYNDKPAVEWRDGSKYWYRNGMNHRLYGPAVEFNNDKYWYLFDKEYSEDEYNEIMKNAPLFYWKNRDKL
jgi:hypothetical protein